MGSNNTRTKQHGAMSPTIVAQQLETTYDFVSSFVLANASTDYDLRTQQSTSFKNVNTAYFLQIWTDEDISIKLNSTSNPAIALSAVESPLAFKDMFSISEVFLTNASGANANVKVLMA